MFDTILQNAATRFGISLEQAKQMLGMLIGLIYSEKRGGPAGFVDLFRSRGLGDMVASWIGHGPNQAIAPAQLESVLGTDVINHIANHARVDHATAASTMSAMLPDVFNHLTDNGQIPVGNTIPDHLRHYTHGIEDFFHHIGAATVATGAAAAAAVGSAVHHATTPTPAPVVTERVVTERAAPAPTVAPVAPPPSGVGKLLPWILLAGLALLGLFALSRCHKEEPAPATPATTTTTTTTTTTEAAKPNQPQAASTFSFENVDGTKVAVAGALASEAEKSRLMDALKKTFGDGNVNGDISISPNTAPAGWLDKFISLLPDLKAKGAKVAFDGDKLKIDTSGMPEADRISLSEKIRAAFGGYEIHGLWDKAMAALSGLKEGFTGEDLTKALNLMNVYFETGKSNITKDSFETLEKAAEAIKKAPAGTKIEAGGHTDNTGQPAANMKLSEERANAVVAKLKELGVQDGVLSAKGYGDTKPIAPNTTEEGKAKNRRMEFTVLK